MSMPRETGKDRWRRVPKDYFKKRDGLQSLKLRLSGLAMVLALGWIALGVDWNKPFSWTSTDLNSLRANHGTLARVHAAWDQKCDACHVPFEPIHGRGLFASRSSPSNRSSDQLCMSCHAGPSHHASMIESEVKGCADCHLDHQGRDFSMVRLTDNECTSCHSSLKKHTDLAKKRPGSRTFGDVSRFDRDHPPFTLEDRGQLKFNHARHMMPGIVQKLGDTPYTFEQIALGSERGRYQGSSKPSDPVQLDCSSCHHLDSSEIKASANPAVASASFPARSPGRYYLPVKFENDCRGCHALTFDPRIKDVEVPHGVQPDKVVEFIKQTYAAQLVSNDPKLLEVFVPSVRLPGKAPMEATARKRLDDAVANALTFLFPRATARGGNSNNCLECHSYAQVDASGVPTRVEPTNVPVIWFTHASFDHQAHRGVSCLECHLRSIASKVATDVLIPGIDNCIQCHAPSKGQKGGASYDCTECHRYHNGDQTLQGQGASARAATIERSIAEFLKAETKSLRP